MRHWLTTATWCDRSNNFAVRRILLCNGISENLKQFDEELLTKQLED